MTPPPFPRAKVMGERKSGTSLVNALLALNFDVETFPNARRFAALHDRDCRKIRSKLPDDPYSALEVEFAPLLLRINSEKRSTKAGYAPCARISGRSRSDAICP